MRQIKRTRLPFAQNLLKIKKNYLPGREKKANDRYNNEGYTIGMIIVEINEV